jgi:hypothetical protein
MAGSTFGTHSDVIRAGLAHELGCSAEDLASEQLTVVPLPSGTPPGTIGLVACSGLGAVASVEPSLVQWVRDNAPTARHYLALQPFFLEQIAKRAMETGLAVDVRGHGYSTAFALDVLHAIPPLPDGFTKRIVGADWMPPYRDTKDFNNALAAPDDTVQIARIRDAVAVLDPAGEPVALAGWWDDGHGYREIGVDVRRDARGMGLGRLVTIAATHQIIEASQTPFYSCRITNIRSHRNALACGFLPVHVIGLVRSYSE